MSNFKKQTSIVSHCLCDVLVGDALASYPGHAEKRVAFAHVRPFREKPGNPCMFGNGPFNRYMLYFCIIGDGEFADSASL